MKIKTLSYQQHIDKPTVWSFCDFVLNPRINLIVGKNATGKTRIYNIIRNFAMLLSGAQKDLYSSAHWNIEFSTGNASVDGNQSERKVHYELELKDKQVIKEELSIDGKLLLQRSEDGTGTLYYEGLEKDLEFEITKQHLAVVQKRDTKQHSYLELICEWADSTLTYPFATDMGRESVIVQSSTSEATETNVSTEADRISTKNPQTVIRIYQLGSKIAGFEEQVKEDMKSIGYDLESIELDTRPDMSLHIKNVPLGNKPQCLHIKERDIKVPIPQHELSQGMFRALSLVIHLNYVEYSKAHHPTCILIDDIGEGLDFERSTKLIKLLVEKVESGQIEGIQLIMTSNDRFVMNKVPLEYWSIVERATQGLTFYNSTNSPEIFKKFKMAGLNNFDLFSSDFYKGK